MITVKDLRVVLSHRAIVSDVSFTLDRGAFLALLGPNGGGKSTLVRALVGLQPYEGTISFQDSATPVGYVPQIKTLDRTFPAQTRELVATALKKQWPWTMDQQCRDVVDKALERVGMLSKADEQIRHLSGGELQRAYLARAIISTPKLLVLDEPSAGVDMTGASDMLEIVEKYRKDVSATVVMVTHDWEIALHHATHVMLMKQVPISFGSAAEAMTDETIRRAFGHVGHAHDVMGGSTHHG